MFSFNGVNGPELKRTLYVSSSSPSGSTASEVAVYYFRLVYSFSIQVHFSLSFFDSNNSRIWIIFDPVTTNFDLDSVKMNHRVKYLGQRSFDSKVIAYTYTDTMGMTDPPGALKCSINI